MSMLTRAYLIRRGISLLIFEAVESLRITTKTRGVLLLTPGQRMELPDEAVRQLMEKVPRKIRIVEESLSPEPGYWVSFRSPLFGPCVAKIREVLTEGLVITDHSVIGTQEGMTIPTPWIERIYKEEL